MKQHRNYCTTRKELLSIMKFCRQFRHYLLGPFFIIRTDHNSLVWLTRFKHLEGQLARFMEELSQYNFKIVHQRGAEHNNADALSRIEDILLLATAKELELGLKISHVEDALLQQSA